jgi:glycosyltransferase involved in cell wall biosynthesis
VLGERPRVVYLIDVGISTTISAVVARLRRATVVLDTGDLAYQLARSIGARSRLGLAIIWLGERVALACSHHVVIRGRRHAAYLGRKPTTFAPDLAPPDARPRDGSAVRSQLGIEDRFVVGLVGSLNLAPNLGISYGWDVIEALALTPPRIVAVIVGDGDGRAALVQRAAKLGVSTRCHFAGSVPPSEVSKWVGAMDVGVSTQTNDAVGSVRTTGKLPLYLACGCPVLASDVGEAQALLGPVGWTLPYEGVVDRAYPARLADALMSWSQDSAAHDERRETALALARQAFDAHTVRAHVNALVDELLETAPRTRACVKQA